MKYAILLFLIFLVSCKPVVDEPSKEQEEFICSIDNPCALFYTKLSPENPCRPCSFDDPGWACISRDEFVARADELVNQGLDNTKCEPCELVPENRYYSCICTDEECKKTTVAVDEDSYQFHRIIEDTGFSACTTDDDCTITDNHCGSCACGSPINKEKEKEFSSLFKQMCKKYDGEECQIECDQKTPKCIDNFCKLI